MARWWRRKKAIERKYISLGGDKSILGAPKTSETSAADGVGCFSDYRDGSIYWSPSTGAHEVHGAIFFKWNSLEREYGILGYPVSDEETTSDGIGHVSSFQKGCIYWTATTGAHAVKGPILDLWRDLGCEKSTLGYPTSDELDGPYVGCRYNRFERGSIFWDHDRGAYEVFPLPVSKECDSISDGKWDVALYDSKVVGIHAALLHTDRVLFFSHGDPPESGSEHSVSDVGSTVLDLQTRTVKERDFDYGLICSGHAFFPDGKLLACGSERKRSGVQAIRVFDPEGNDGGTWTHLCQQLEARWYPTCTSLPDGRVFIIGGHKWFEDENTPNATCEIVDRSKGIQHVQAVPFFMNENRSALYPFVFVLPTGNLLIHCGTETHFFNLATLAFEQTTFSTVDRPDRNSRTYDVQGTAVLLPMLPDSNPPYAARVMLIGGGGDPENTPRATATNTCEILDFGSSSPAWELAAPMANQRVMPDAVLLPDGNVFVTNGSSTGRADTGVNPVLDAELYDPHLGTWRTLAAMRIPRLYHSVALLLPDARIMTAGTDSAWYRAPFNEAKLRVEIFSPPYLFQAGRPIIVHAPNQIGYAEEFDVEVARAVAIKSAALISPGSVTHSFNATQRYVGLQIQKMDTNQVRLVSPPSPNIAPPGYYMLFIVNDSGAPSVARFIRLL